MQKSYNLTATVAATIAGALHKERLQYRLTQNEMAARLRIAPKVEAKLERQEVLRIQSEDIAELQRYFGEHLGIEKVYLDNAR